jgi:hypothetical protein
VKLDVLVLVESWREEIYRNWTPSRGTLYLLLLRPSPGILTLA